MGDIDPIQRPDIQIGAVVKAERLRFTEVPDTEVDFHGDEDSVSTTDRENLPDEIEPGVEYRDVKVRWLAAARLDVRRTDR
jgi:hypothetical protein